MKDIHVYNFELEELAWMRLVYAQAVHCTLIVPSPSWGLTDGLPSLLRFLITLLR